MATLLLLFLLSFSSHIVASDFLTPQGDKRGGFHRTDDSPAGTSSPARRAQADEEESGPRTPAHSSLCSDSMDSEQLAKYPQKTPANIDPFEGESICKLIKQKKYQQVTERIENCLNSLSERAKASLKKKLRTTTKFSVNPATVVSYIPIEYAARKYENPKEGELYGHASEIAELFAKLAKAHIELLGNLPVSLDELCKHKEELLVILNRYKSEIRLETRNHHELVEGRPQYAPSPATPGQRRTSLNFSDISGSGGDLMIDLSTSFTTTPAVRSTSKLQRSLFDGDGNEDDLSLAGQSVQRGDKKELARKPAKIKPLFSDEEEAGSEDSSGEQESDNELGAHEEGDNPQALTEAGDAAVDNGYDCSQDVEYVIDAVQKAARGEQHELGQPSECGDNAPASGDGTLEKNQQQEESASTSTMKDTGSWLAPYGEQLRAMSGSLHRNRNVAIMGFVIVGLLVAAWKYRSSSDEASNAGE